MANVVTTDKAIRFKSGSVSKSALLKAEEITGSNPGVKIRGESVSVQIYLSDTIDGQSFATTRAMREYIDANFFYDGGGTGEGVQSIQAGDGISIDDSDPTSPLISADAQTPSYEDITGLEEGNVIVGGADGNEQRTLTGLDIKVATDGSATRVARVGPDGTMVGSYGVWADNPNPNTIAQRTSAGQIYVAAAVNANHAVNLAQAQSMVAGVYKFKGSVADEASLPTEDNIVGDVWNTLDTDMNFAWTGTEWDPLATSVDLTNYYNKTETNGLLDGKIDVGGVLPTDLGLTDVGGMMIRNSTGNREQMLLRSSPINSSVAQRTPTGQGKFQPAINADEAVTLGQIPQVVQDWLLTLTGATTPGNVLTVNSTGDGFEFITPA